MKKTLIVLLMVLLSAMLIISCNGDASEPKTETPAETPAEPTTPAESNPTTYTVTFNSNGGTGNPEPQTHEAGEKVTKPNDPTKGGFDFAGWTKDGTDFNFDSDTVTGNMTLVAKWNYKTYQVGDTGPARGKIFYVADQVQTSTYVDASGTTVTYTWKYLEAATEDLTITNEDNSTTGEIKYFGYYAKPGTKYDGSTMYSPAIVTTENSASDGSGANAEIGQGRYNTTMLVNTMKNADTGSIHDDAQQTDNYAAKLCTNYRGGGYSDWFLPSLKELKEMYNNKDQISFTLCTTDNSSSGGTYAAYWSSSEVNQKNAWTLRSSNGAYFSASRDSTYKYARAIRAF